MQDASPHCWVVDGVHSTQPAMKEIAAETYHVCTFMHVCACVHVLMELTLQQVEQKELWGQNSTIVPVF